MSSPSIGALLQIATTSILVSTPSPTNPDREYGDLFQKFMEKVSSVSKSRWLDHFEIHVVQPLNAKVKNYSNDACGKHINLIRTFLKNYPDCQVTAEQFCHKKEKKGSEVIEVTAEGLKHSRWVNEELATPKFASFLYFSPTSNPEKGSLGDRKVSKTELKKDSISHDSKTHELTPLEPSKKGLPKSKSSTAKGFLILKFTADKSQITTPKFEFAIADWEYAGLLHKFMQQVSSFSKSRWLDHFDVHVVNALKAKVKDYDRHACGKHINLIRAFLVKYPDCQVVEELFCCQRSIANSLTTDVTAEGLHYTSWMNEDLATPKFASPCAIDWEYSTRLSEFFNKLQSASYPLINFQREVVDPLKRLYKYEDDVKPNCHSHIEAMRVFLKMYPKFEVVDGTLVKKE